MHFNEKSHQILGAVWLVLGIMIPFFYFTPLFGTVLYKLNGIDVLTVIDNLSDEKLRTFDQVSGILMVVLPQVMVFLGFMGLSLGIYGLIARKGPLKFHYVILSLVTLLTSLFCAFRLESELSGFFAMFKPTPQFGFYFMMTLLVLIILAPIIISVTFPSREKTTF